jgi:RNA polymerase sigma-70 factor (ECF subfamily)
MCNVRNRRHDPLDAVLAGRAAAGDREAFGVLFRRYHPLVLRFFARRLRNRDAAGEAAQETFARAFARVGTLRAAERVRPWLFAFARNVLREWWRARPAAEATAETTAEGDGDERNPEALLLGRELGAAIDEALGRLPKVRRQALLLRVDEESDYFAIARQLGWSRQKVKNEIHRARLHLRGRLHGWARAGA